MDKFMAAQVIHGAASNRLSLRQGYVVSSGGGVATIRLDDSTISGVKYLGNAPVSDQACWILVSDMDILIIGQTS